MRTPRPAVARRGIGTLIGNGWLRESPRNLWPHHWDIRGRSALRKCMFLPMPLEMRQKFLEAMPPAVSPAALPPIPKKRAEEPIIPHRHDPRKDARMFAAVDPAEVQAKARRALYEAEKAKLLKPHRGGERSSSSGPAKWYEDPVALGTLLLVAPPIGLAALWSSRRYSTDARWALTVMTGLTLSVAAAIVFALIVRS